MALPTRRLVLIARLAALAGALLLKGKKRTVAWAAHDFLWLYPTLRRNCTWHGPVATRFETSRPEVWLTIDDGPDPRDTPEILDLLARHQAKATFFVIGRKVELYPELTRRIVAEGHTLGNHTFRHPARLWWAYPRALVRREIQRCNAALLAVAGVRTRWFRSPVGMNNAAIHPSAHRLGHRVVGWSASGTDGCCAAPTQIVRRIMATLQPGAIILIHESGDSRHRVMTLARLLDSLDAAGYRCVVPTDAALR